MTLSGVKYDSTAKCGNSRLQSFSIYETLHVYTPVLTPVYTHIYLSIHSYMYISIYICSPVKQKNTEFFQKKAKIRKIPNKNKNGTIPSKQPKN